MTGANAIHVAEKPMSKEEEAQQQPAVENGAAAVVLPPAAAAGLPPYSSVLLQPVEQGQGFTSVAFNTPTAVPVNTAPAPVEKAPRDYLYLAIFSTICCFFPVGIFAIVKSRDVHKKFGQGQSKSANKASRKAKYLSIAAMIIGILMFIVIGAAVWNYEAHINDGVVDSDHPFNGIIDDD
ncbi:proline-rich transmembrane protein 1-like [Asterias rubens]|uniref:proline-rich transmembrane protein 1-like n=1 Tax=Asterias rubens TaxID=7604 RepID=UPI0014556395|nr:proline-rich transmembrane protein 1-like [Asterias rubens]